MTFYDQIVIFRPAMSNLTLFTTWPQIPYFFNTLGTLVKYTRIMNERLRCVLSNATMAETRALK